MKKSDSISHSNEAGKAVLFAVIFFAIIAIVTYFAWNA